MAETLKCNAQETAACCCVDVGTVMDNTELTVSYQHQFATQAEAEKMLNTLTERAHAVESEPCQINSKITSIDDGVELDVSFTFACEAELLIFQLSLR